MRETTRCKAVVIGASAAGKTSLVLRYTENHFDPGVRATFGADLKLKQVRLNENESVLLQFWDTAGQERFRALHRNYYRGANCCVLVYSIDDRESFRSLDTWFNDFAFETGTDIWNGFPFILLGNKQDRRSQRVVSPAEAEAWSLLRNNMPYYEVSAADGTNVHEAFDSLAARAAEWVKSGETIKRTESVVTLNINRPSNGRRGRCKLCS